MSHGTHVSVLLEESVAAMVLRADGTYVDGTFGRGGHSRAILARLSPRGRVVAIDRDPDAGRAAAALHDGRLVFRRARFSALDDVLDDLAIDLCDGLLLDLGVSSPQIDTPARGFSFRHEGPLDMRMDPDAGEPAAAFIARASLRELTEVIRDHGEERLAQPIARAIVAARAISPVVTTRQLAAIVAQAVGSRTRGDWRQDPATRTFQALRMAVNAELGELETLLAAVPRVLKQGGVAALISFHSLEDRAVKQAFVREAKGCICPPEQPACTCGRWPRLEILTRKPLTPDDEESRANPRARSAKLRGARRLPDPAGKEATW